MVIRENQLVLLIGGERRIQLADQRFGWLGGRIGGSHARRCCSDCSHGGCSADGLEKVAPAPDFGQIESFVALGAIEPGLVEHGAFLPVRGNGEARRATTRWRFGRCRLVIVIADAVGKYFLASM